MEPAWSRGQRVVFRFVFVYFVFYIFPWPLGTVPGTRWPADFYTQGLEALVPWVGAHVLGLDQPAASFPTGSGDTLFNFVQLFVNVALAAVVTAGWSLLGRARAYPRLHDALRVYLRFFLLAMMLSYGLAKTWKSQFPLPSDLRLMQPFGAATKMGLLWTFMGASTPYTIFAGLSEVAGGLLLMFRRTTTLGALVVAGVMTNVVVLNFCYDVPVKQFSVHLLLMALVLATPELPRLLDLLVFHRPTTPRPLAPSPSRAVTRARQAVGLLFAGFLIYTTVQDERETYPKYGDGKPADEVYEIEAMEPRIWKRLSMNPTSGTLSVLDSGDVIERYRMVRDEAAGTLVLSEVFARPAKFPLQLTRLDADRLKLSGQLRGQAIDVTLRRASAAVNRLGETELHWIQEYPNNH